MHGCLGADVRVAICHARSRPQTLLKPLRRSGFGLPPPPPPPAARMIHDQDPISNTLFYTGRSGHVRLLATHVRLPSCTFLAFRAGNVAEYSLHVLGPWVRALVTDAWSSSISGGHF